MIKTLIRDKKGGKARRTLAALLLAAALVFAALPSGAAARISAPLPDEAIERDERGVSGISSETGDPIRGLAGIDDVKAPALDEDFTTIRVLISVGSTSYINLDLGTEYLLPESGRILSGSEASPYPIKVSVSSGVVSITDRSTGEVLASGSTVDLERTVIGYEAGVATLTHSADSDTQGRMYLGDFRFSASSGNVRMINIVPMAYYLYGIVGYELNTSSYPEALKAQAVAAKTYGIFFMDFSDGSEYDVQDGWSSALYQAYRGFRENRLVTMPFCLAVAGEALAYNGRFIPTFYGHSDGGETALPSQVFGSSQYDVGYDVFIDDIEFDYYPGSRQLINVEFGGTGDSSRFRDFILGKINDIYGEDSFEVVSISELYTFDPLPGTQRNMRQLHVAATVKHYTEVMPTDPPVPTDEPIATDPPQKDGEPDPTPTSAPTETPEPTATPEPTPVIVEVEEEFSFECATSQLRSYALTDIDGSGDNYSSSKYVFTSNYKLYWGRETENGYTLIFSRYGNGVGLSQTGALARANPDTFAQDYREILAFYYPNFELINITERTPDEMGGPSPVPSPALAYAVCTDDNTNFRMGPGTSYPSMGKVQTNEHLDLLEATENGWYKARWNGMTGYIIMDYVRIILFPSPAGGVFTLTDGVTNISCNLRSEPYIRDSNIITRLPSGTGFTSWMHFGKWHYVTTDNGYAGFVSNVVVTFYDPYEYTGVASLAYKEYPTISPGSQLMPLLPPSPGRKEKPKG
ncbi:MAG: SH3 domain-containing protein [Clostridia bacterium]|nr:SH3 domain-containing protein [Clostridia bacterium]